MDTTIEYPVIGCWPVHSEQPSEWESIHKRSPRQLDGCGLTAAVTEGPEPQHLHPGRRGALGSGSQTRHPRRSGLLVPQTWVSWERTNGSACLHRTGPTEHTEVQTQRKSPALSQAVKPGLEPASQLHPVCLGRSALKSGQEQVLSPLTHTTGEHLYVSNIFKNIGDVALNNSNLCLWIQKHFLANVLALLAV